MDSSRIAELRSRVVRKGAVTFGVLFLPVASIGFLDSFSGPLSVIVAFYVVTMVSCAYASYLFGCAAWWYGKDSILKQAESAAENRA